MRHPDSLARLLRLRSTWRTPGRASRANDAVDWEDAAAALAGAGELPYAAFLARYADDGPRPELVQHLLEIARRELPARLKVAPEALVALALHEERIAETRRTAAARCQALGCCKAYFYRYVRRPYSRVAQEVDHLVSDAWRVARGRLEAE